ncbi:tetratricopeptide repeat protein [Undibacterium sp.]|uniref:tetratricopeptide repeat protein n=1 Tax=Undibacterium sp. TaxID=1914977 RepID=UPI002C86EE1F|nr:tetratricopeptide repeat protein [Undibacterium sp.]HTD06857.1 tetratricopeptide repeat protein [Undibacterium sp.]
MKKNSTIVAAALLVALGSSALPFTMSQAQAQTKPAPAAPSETIRVEIGKPLNEAQELVNKKEYAEALAKIKALDAVPNKTPGELFMIDRATAVIASATNDNALLAKSFDGMINSKRLSAADVLKFTDGMASVYFNSKDYPNAKIWAERYLALDTTNPQVYNLLARILYLQDDFPGAAKQLNELIKTEDAAGRTTSHDTLRLLASSYQHMKDKNGYRSVLERLVKDYPSKDYWADLLYQTETKPGFSDRLRLDEYRLEFAAGNLNEAGRFVEMIQLLQQAGIPGEAKKVIDKGYAENVLGTGKDAARHKQLRDQVNKQAADDAKSLSDGEKQARTAKTGTGLVNIGYNYTVYGQFDKGIPMMEEGIAKGGLKNPDDAKLRLGAAYLQSGNRAKAEEIFKTIQSTDGAADLARLWLLIK